jgi:hypothetical protein
MTTVEERGIGADPMKASLLSAAQTLEGVAHGNREEQLAGLRDAAIAIERNLDLFASESRPGGSKVLKARVLPQAAPLQVRLRELLVSAWQAEQTITAEGASSAVVAKVASTIRSAADDVLRLVHESMSYDDTD